MRYSGLGLASARLTTSAQATLIQTALPAGIYQGGYVCTQGTTALRLTVNARQTARFEFGGNAGLPRGAYIVLVGADGSGGITLTPQRWLRQPAGYGMVGARLRRNGAQLTGTITDPACRNVALERVG